MLVFENVEFGCFVWGMLCMWCECVCVMFDVVGFVVCEWYCFGELFGGE